MTENNDELLERISDLRLLSIKKKYRLAKPESDEVVKTLSSLCLFGLSGVKTTLDSLTDFPSDTGAEVICKNWTDISAHIDEFYRALKGKKYNTELGKRLRLLIGRRLSSVAPEVSIRIILDVCRDMTHTKRALPNSKDLSLINSALLSGDLSFLSQLQLELGLQSNSSQFVSYCLAAGFSADKLGKSIVTPQTQLVLIKWANGNSKYLNLVRDVQLLIASRVRDWSKAYLDILESELDNLNASLKDPIRTVLDELSVRNESHLTDSAVSPTQLNEYKEEAGAQETVHIEPQVQQIEYDPIKELERLAKYINKANRDLISAFAKVTVMEQRLNEAQDDKSAIRHEKEELTRQMSLVNTELSESNARVKKFEQNNKSQQELIDNLRRQLDTINKQQLDLLESHKKQIDDLSSRIAKEGDHRLEIFRNKLAGLLRPISADFKGARSLEMNADLGIAMRTLLGQVLTILKSQGIPIEGEEK